MICPYMNEGVIKQLLGQASNNESIMLEESLMGDPKFFIWKPVKRSGTARIQGVQKLLPDPLIYILRFYDLISIVSNNVWRKSGSYL